MSKVTKEVNDYKAITETIQHYINGARSGKGDEMEPAFHSDATVFGYVGTDLLAGPIKILLDWNDNNGPAQELETHLARIDLTDTVATVRLELDNWTGLRFTDLFTLLKVDGQWKIMNKVFHAHS